MIVDYRLQRVFKEVKAKLLEEGIEITEELIEAIVDSQSQVIKIGMEQCDKIVCSYLGTFDIKKRTQFIYDISKEHNLENNITQRIDNKIKKVIFKPNAI